MTISLYKDSDRDRWNAYVMNSEDASCYHLIEWKDVIEKTFGHKTYYLLSDDYEGKINGLLPIVQLKSLLFDNYGVSLPFFNYGGVCADDNAIRDELLNEAVNIARSHNMKHLELRHVQNSENNLPVKTSKVSMRLTLPDNPEILWKGFSSKLRSQVKRPTKEEMYSKLGREEDLHSFYSVFSMNMRDLGTPVYPKSFFKNILHAFAETTWISTVYTKDHVPVASGLLLGFKSTLEIPWASSLRDYNKYSPNNLLYWSVLKFACNQGYKVFDFGRSTPSEGTYKFKEQWGARPTQLYWHYWMSNGAHLPELNPHNPKYEFAIKLWRKLPVWFTKMIGPSIVKNLP
jgi:FemAB-related protein (PEP-CTERM system-associated)